VNPLIKLLGGLSALMVFFGTATGFIFLLMAMDSAIEESGCVRTTGTIVERVPYHGKKGDISYTVVYEYELNGHKHRCHGHQGWREEIDALGNTTDMIVQPTPPYTVRFGTPTELRNGHIVRLFVSLVLVVVGFLIGLRVKRAEPTFEHHPWHMAGITFFMMFLLMGGLTVMEGIRGAFKANGVETPATVVAVQEETTPKGNREYSIVFEHTIGDNTVKATPERTYREPPCRVGDEMTIRYDRANVSKVVSSPCDDGVRFLSPTCVPCLLAIVLCGFCLMRSNRLYPKPEELKE
jgi:ABC-type amino acid transport system permease subunit